MNITTATRIVTDNTRQSDPDFYFGKNDADVFASFIDDGVDENEINEWISDGQIEGEIADAYLMVVRHYAL